MRKILFLFRHHSPPTKTRELSLVSSHIFNCFIRNHICAVVCCRSKTMTPRSAGPVTSLARKHVLGILPADMWAQLIGGDDLVTTKNPWLLTLKPKLWIWFHWRISFYILAWLWRRNLGLGCQALLACFSERHPAPFLPGLLTSTFSSQLVPWEDCVMKTSKVFQLRMKVFTEGLKGQQKGYLFA